MEEDSNKILSIKRRLLHLKNIMNPHKKNDLIGIYLTSSKENSNEEKKKIDFFDSDSIPKKIIINDVQIDLQV